MKQVQRQIDTATGELKELAARIAIARSASDRESELANTGARDLATHADKAAGSNDHVQETFSLPTIAQYRTASMSRAEAADPGGHPW